MTVSELRDQLSGLPGDLVVCYINDEGEPLPADRLDTESYWARRLFSRQCMEKMGIDRNTILNCVVIE